MDIEDEIGTAAHLDETDRPPNVAVFELAYRASFVLTVPEAGVELFVGSRLFLDAQNGSIHISHSNDRPPQSLPLDEDETIEVWKSLSLATVQGWMRRVR